MAALLEPNHPVAKTVMQAHMGAVEAVARSAGRMIEPQNSRGAATDKWLGVIFHHTHTRENDPHLHSHVILPNVMFNRDGQWRAMQVMIAGPNRLKLELIYGHNLAVQLRRFGFGPEIVMRSNGVPELRALQPLTRTFAKARINVLEAARAAESERARNERVKAGWQQGAVARAFPRGFYDNDRLDRRDKLADQQRRPKPRGADDPVKLTHEAERWKLELSNQDHRQLMTLLDGLDVTNARRQVAVVREGPPPSARAIVQQSYMQIPEGARTTGPVLFRGAVVLSGGRHPWEDLLAEAKDRMARRRKFLSRLRAQMDADSFALAHAQIEAANQTFEARTPIPTATEIASAPVREAETAAPTTPTDSPVARTPAVKPTTGPTPAKGRRGR